jgi:hypothetical protein
VALEKEIEQETIRGNENEHEHDNENKGHIKLTKGRYLNTILYM